MLMSKQARNTTDKSIEKVVINSVQALQEAAGKLQGMFRDHKYLVVSIRPGRDRSLDQNKLWRAMYKRISEATGNTIEQANAECKLMIGVPILRRDDERFARGWERYFANENYETQLFLMGANPLFGPDGFPVTRLFGTKQGCEYTDAIADIYSQQGVFFDDLLSENRS